MLILFDAYYLQKILDNTKSNAYAYSRAELDVNEYYYHNLEIKMVILQLIQFGCACNENKHYI